VALVATPGTSILTGTNLLVYVMRTIHFQAPTSGKTVTFSIGADAAAKRLFDAYALTLNVPAIFNGWWVLTGSGAAHDLDASISATAGTVSVHGYSFA
jgi:hypothetical protein